MKHPGEEPLAISLDDLASYVGQKVSVFTVQRQNDFDAPVPVWGISDRFPTRETGILEFDGVGYPVKAPSGRHYLGMETFHISSPQLEE